MGKLVRVIAVLVLVAAAPHEVPAGEPPDAPASWLPDAGKGDGWRADTARCRELLAKLDLTGERARRWAPRVRDKCLTLRNADGFDWKTRTAVEFLEGILEVQVSHYAATLVADSVCSWHFQNVSQRWLRTIAAKITQP